MSHDEINVQLAFLGFSLSAEFIPFNLSRNAKPNPKISEMSLNWRVTIHHQNPIGDRGKQSILTTDYMQGIGHCPAYVKNGDKTILAQQAIRKECETGKVAFYHSNADILTLGKPIDPPTLAEVLGCLCSDASAIDYPSFEDWARTHGYDPDSRKAENIYRACLEIALKLRNSLGERLFAQVCEIVREF